MFLVCLVIYKTTLRKGHVTWVSQHSANLVVIGTAVAET